MQKTKSLSSSPLTIGGVILALLVSIVWGINYLMIKIGLEQLPPLTLCALRFLLASLPAIFFVPKPNVAWKYIIAYGLMTFALQFSLLFLGMEAGVAPGAASIIIQIDVFFAVFFAYILLQQNINLWQLLGAIVSFSGIFIMGWHHDKNCSLLGFILILGAAAAWGLGTIISAQLKNVNMFSLMVWSSFIAFFPLFGMALLYEHPLPFLAHPEQLTSHSVIALLYITYLSTYFGYGCWSWLLSKYPVASIAPFALLSSIVAMISSAILVNETMDLWKVIASIFVITGLCFNIFGKTITTWFLNHKVTDKPIYP